MLDKATMVSQKVTFFVMTFLCSSFSLEAGTLHYFNRKKVENQKTELNQKLANLILAGKDVLILDTNPKISIYEELNIVNPMAAAKLKNEAYQLLSTEKKEEYIFRPFFERMLTAAKSKHKMGFIIHIDHHHDIATIDSTSTTVMTADFLEWIYKAKEQKVISKDNASVVLEFLSNADGILDHSDADILLSHLLMLNAKDRNFIFRNSDLFKATALFNDYLLETSTDLKSNAKMRSFFFVIDGIDRELAKTSNSIQAMAQIKEALILIERFENMRTPSEKYDADFAAWLSQTPQLSAEDQNLVSFFNSGYKDQVKNFELVSKLHDASQSDEFKISSAHMISKPGLYSLGKLLIAYPQTKFDSSDMFLGLKNIAHANLNGAQVLVTVSAEPQGPTFVKLRTLHPHFDLNPVYSHLKNIGIAADGRAKAGSGAYGMSGATNLKFEELAQTLEAISAAVSIYSCTPHIARLSETKGQ